MVLAATLLIFNVKHCSEVLGVICFLYRLHVQRTTMGYLMDTLVLMLQLIVHPICTASLLKAQTILQIQKKL